MNYNHRIVTRERIAVLVLGLAAASCASEADEVDTTAAPDTSAAMEASVAVADGGILVDGWMGRIDAQEVEAGNTLEDARLAMEGDVLRVTTGPAVTYWNPANTATGEYTVSATFTEAEYMSINDHPHPYGIVVAGNDLGTDQQSYLYCAAYGNGTFIARGFGPEPFRLNGERPEPNEAISQAAGPGTPVTQEIAVSVDADSVDCSINGTVVGSYPTSEVVTAGRLTSTDGVYGIRFGHNTDGTVSGLTVTP
ncbi:MAG: hypothetical protein WD737_07545 [Gemmatimonadota bacterium]